MIFYNSLPDELAPIVADIRDDLASRFPDDAPKAVADAIDTAAGLAVLSEYLRAQARIEWDIDSVRNYCGTCERFFALMFTLGPSRVSGSYAEQHLISNMQNAQRVMECISPIGFA